MLTGSHILITGVVDRSSIAHAIARRCLDHGATVTLTAPPRDLARATAAAADLGATVHHLDVTDQGDWRDLEATLARDGRPLDGAVHAVAYAPRDALDGLVTDADPDGILLAMHTSVVSYVSLARLLRQLAPVRASLVGLDFDAARAWPTYNWMGVLQGRAGVRQPLRRP